MIHAIRTNGHCPCPQSPRESASAISRALGLLRLVLLLFGAGVTLSGIDTAFGGIATLGWRGPPDFFSVTNTEAFAVRDNHVRFLAGIWLGMGLILGVAAFQLARLQSVVVAFPAMIFVGGLLRLKQDDRAVLLSPRLLPALVVEPVVCPLVALWVLSSARPKTADSQGAKRPAAVTGPDACTKNPDRHAARVSTVGKHRPKGLIRRP
ncbi:DUF4345 domain-containing protein [Lacimonas salitolerans]|uniref:DUF4345 domain-containing protein n=1 Tax=Lacimonas salitolerans TaxID=1323750 RepID=A0ABW4ECH3_9RHOB